MTNDRLIQDLKAACEQGGWSFWIAGPQPEASVDKVEDLLGHSLPPDFRGFLLKYGMIAVADSFICGIDEDVTAEETGQVLYDTRACIAKVGLPEGCIVVDPDHDEFMPFAIDLTKTAADGRCPVMRYSNGEPVPISPTFDAYLERWLKIQIAATEQ